jgi:hypothetical protein
MSSHKSRQLRDAYRFPGFVAQAAVRGVFGDPKAVVVKLTRRQKKRDALNAANAVAATTIIGKRECGTCPARTGGFTWKWKFDAWTVRAVEA